LHKNTDVTLNTAPSKQEAVRVNNVVVLAMCNQEALWQQQQRLLTRGYRSSETQHFLVCQHASFQHIVLLHTFDQSDIDADLICYIEQELSAYGLILTEKDFGAVLFAMLASTFPSPRHQPAIWHRFCVNSLTKLRDQLNHPSPVSPSTMSYITPFAAIYRRVFELFVGQSFLDVGCSFGFLLVLMAEQAKEATIMGCDLNPDALSFATDLAATTGVPQVLLSLQDVLDPTIRCLGSFDTVTALHLLEHLQEQDMPVALMHLLQMTTKRLIIAVPYEEQVRALYGHVQRFTPEKLHTWGRWCIDSLEGRGRYWCEEVMGGLLIVERIVEIVER
jgi:SAM-dependent methyltransferase